MIDRLGEQYRNDPYFANLVDLFLNQMEQHETTAREIRDVAMYAQHIFEMRHPTPIYIQRKNLMNYETPKP